MGVAEKTGFINAGLKLLLGRTSPRLLTPMLILAAIVSHTAADAGYVLVIPLGGVIFYAAGRHPLAGISAAFAGVSGGFSANFIPSGIDPLLQGFTQQAAQILDPERLVNPLSNLGFTAVSSLLVVGVGWYLTDRVIEPRLQATPIDGDPDAMPRMEELTDRDRRGFGAGMAALVAGLLLLALAALPAGSPLRGEDGSLTSFAAPLMGMIVPLIFLLFLIPGAGARLRGGHGQVASRHRRGHDRRDGHDGLLPGDGVLRRAVHRRVQQLQRRPADRAQGRQLPARPQHAGPGDGGRHRAADRVRQPVRRVGLRQVGAALGASSCRC